MKYLAGNMLMLSATFADAATGAAVDPDDVTCTVRMPGGTQIAAAVVQDGIGSYHADFSLVGMPAGAYVYSWQGTGVYEAAGEDGFEVLASRLS